MTVRGADVCANPEILDAGALAHLRRFGQGRGSRAIAELVDTFESEAAERIAGMRSAIRDKDFLAATTAAHNLGGTSLSMAAKLPAAGCRRVESWAEQGDELMCAAEVDGVEHEVHRAISEIRRCLGLHESTSVSDDHPGC